MSEFLFESLELSPEIIRAIEEMNFKTATEIQAKAIPLLLEGRDLIGRSNTGTGKTAAFGIPAIEMVDTNLKKPQIMILSPTRELALQISDEMEKFARFKRGVNMVCVYGGQPIDGQIRKLRTANVVIGTPGRIMDHMRRKTLKLNDLQMIILDEADEMLNMGFIDDIKTILSEIPEERQTVLFSATMPPAIMSITKEFQKDPEMIVINKGQRTLDAIEQVYYQVPMGRKKDVLNMVLQTDEPKRSVVFCNTKKMVDELVIFLNENGYKSIGLHGDMKQNVRSNVMENYKNGRINILVATDVAARGIDVENVEAVFNYDIPQDNEYYIHRIGRTGRAGKTGTAYTFITNRKQLYWARDIAKFTKSKMEQREIPTIEDILVKKKGKLVQRIERYLNKEKHGNWEKEIAQFVENGYDKDAIIVALMDMISSKDKKNLPTAKVATNARQSGDVRQATKGGKRIKLSVNVGRNHRIAPNFIVGAIVEDTGLPANAIGKIDIFNEHTIIDMNEHDAQVVMDSMENSKIKSQSVKFTIHNSKSNASSSQFDSSRNKSRGNFNRNDRFKNSGKSNYSKNKTESGWK